MTVTQRLSAGSIVSMVLSRVTEIEKYGHSLRYESGAPSFPKQRLCI
jgi:hypothetical protein